MFEDLNASLYEYLHCQQTERKAVLEPQLLRERRLYFAVISQAECLNPPIMPQ